MTLLRDLASARILTEGSYPHPLFPWASLSLIISDINSLSMLGIIVSL